MNIFLKRLKKKFFRNFVKLNSVRLICVVATSSYTDLENYCNIDTAGLKIVFFSKHTSLN